MQIFIETKRTILRQITQQDFDELRSILQDPDVMYAWEYAFEDSDVQNWIDKCISLYNQFNLGYFIAEDKITGEIIGQAALMPDTIKNKKYYEIGYILKKQYWHKGYATEMAKELAQYAFSKLGLDEVIFEIRPSNKPSQKVAQNLGAKIEDEFIKNVHGKQIPHLIYKLKTQKHSTFP